MEKAQDCQLVLLRHGESEWNKKNLFTGWRDVKLTERGEHEAREAGRLLKQGGFVFDLAYTSLQTRAIKTLWLALEQMDLMWIKVLKHWRLNERHYGALQGKDKIAAVAEFGAAQVHEWRRSYTVRPPLVGLDSPDYPGHDRRYDDVPDCDLPRGECLKDVLARVMPYWETVIAPQLRVGKRILIAAHGNSLRALLKHLEGVSDDAIVDVNLPTGVPKAYRLDSTLHAEAAFFLGKPEDIERRINAVKAQTHKT